MTKLKEKPDSARTFLRWAPAGARNAIKAWPATPAPVIATYLLQHNIIREKEDRFELTHKGKQVHHQLTFVGQGK